MNNFRIKPHHVAFANEVAAGTPARDAFLKHISKNKNAGKGSTGVNASRLLKRPQILKLVEEARAEIQKQILERTSRKVADVFTKTDVLTIEEIDNWHYAVIQGLVTVQEVVPQWSWREILDKDGRVKGRERLQSFVTIQRPPNIRERQASADAIYRRQGKYISNKGWAGSGVPDSDEPQDNVQRVVMLSDGKLIPMFTESGQQELSNK